jgi:hypothetical protein
VGLPACEDVAHCAYLAGRFFAGRWNGDSKPHAKGVPGV